MRDRTTEFLSACESIAQRFDNPHSQLLHSQKVTTKSEFSKAASLISKQINDTVARLTKLTTLAKKKSLFEDKPVEINELIYMIKQDLAKIKSQIGQLSNYLTRTAAGQSSLLSNKQTKEHSHNVISSLESKLANTSDAFKSVLKVRSDNLKQQKERKDQYSFVNQAESSSLTSNSPLYHPEKKPTRDVNQSGDAIIDFGSGFQEQQLMEPSQNSAYLEQRDQTIESIESTIAELGQVYKDFANIIAQQREMVQRIDDNTQDVEMNIQGAHSQLLKYYQGISSNRALMFKIFGALMVFFFLFVMMT
ncbi:t-SNARE [Globomyces pollinis-pini]|nr:t-SNARE [Globomyces pollinis-pini]KAJ2994138.1 cis-Golgi t-SNARE syntaxin [Globomyces sp. JEL0801]